MADGARKGPWIYSGNVVSYNDRNIWVDAWVHTLGYNKEVGILWTDNGWYTANWSKCSYELTYSDGVERWGVDLMPIGQFMGHQSSAHGGVERTGFIQTIGSNGKFIEYAIYYVDKNTGRMYGDNNLGHNCLIWGQSRPQRLPGVGRGPSKRWAKREGGTGAGFAFFVTPESLAKRGIVRSGVKMRAGGTLPRETDCSRLAFLRGRTWRRPGRPAEGGPLGGCAARARRLHRSLKIRA